MTVKLALKGDRLVPLGSAIAATLVVAFGGPRGAAVLVAWPLWFGLIGFLGVSVFRVFSRSELELYHGAGTTPPARKQHFTGLGLSDPQPEVPRGPTDAGRPHGGEQGHADGQ